MKTSKKNRQAPATIVTDRAIGALLGLAVGDALGATLEFSTRDAHPPVTDMIGGGPFMLLPGEWTDDTSMALCLADSLIHCGGYDEADMMERFCRWWMDGENSVNCRCFDIGTTTRAALNRYKWDDMEDRRPRKNEASNGSLMRLAPVPIFCAAAGLYSGGMAIKQSRATHRNTIAAEACEWLSQMIYEAITDHSKDFVLTPRMATEPDLGPAIGGAWRGKARSEIRSTGYVVDTLEAALWCVGHSSTFFGALLLAVNLGGDSDTVGAVTGQLAGAIYGRQAIPERWLSKLAWADVIEQKALDLIKAGSARAAVSE